MPRRIAVAWHRDGTLSPAARAVIDAAREVSADLARDLVTARPAALTCYRRDVSVETRRRVRSSTRYVQAVTIRLLMAASCVIVASGCVGPSAAELRGAARSLVPPDSDIVAQVEADCVELARSPSCVHVFFLPSMSARRDRVAAVEEAARTGGWNLVRKEHFIGGTQLRFRRGRLRAVVNLWRDETIARCRRAPSKECADSVAVEPD